MTRWSISYDGLANACEQFCSSVSKRQAGGRSSDNFVKNNMLELRELDEEGYHNNQATDYTDHWSFIVGYHNWRRNGPRLTDEISSMAGQEEFEF